jgi:CHAT domain-containing protein
MILFAKIFSLIKESKALLIVCAVLSFENRILSQNNNTFLRDEILSIYNYSSKKNDEKLRELLHLRQKMTLLHLETDSTYMLLLQKIGVLYFRQSDYNKAIDFTNESIKVARKFISDKLSLVQNYSNLTYYYNSAGQLKNKYEAIDSCIAYAFLCRNGFDMVIGPLSDKAEYLFNKGEYNLCSKYAELGEDITIKYSHGKDSLQGIVSFVMKQANALYYSKNNPAAEKLLQNKVSQFIRTNNTTFLGPFYGLLGLINRDNQNYARALTYFKLGYRENLIIKFKTGCAQSLASIGALYAQHLDDYEKGVEYCSKALKFAENSSDSLFILKQIANVYVLKKMYDKARYFFQLAYNTIKVGMDETTMLKSTFQSPGFNLLQNLSDLTTDKGDAYVKEYHDTRNSTFLKKAISIYKKNDFFLAKIKTEQQLDLASNLVWRTTARNLYEHAVEATYADNNIEDAFYFFEKSRAILLNDQVNEQRWTADSDIAKLAVLKKTIIELTDKLSSTSSSPDEYLRIQKDLYTKNQQLDILASDIKNKNPSYYNNFLDTSFISISELRKKILNNSKTLVEIFSGDSAVYVLNITDNYQSLSKIDKPLYDSLTNSFISFIGNSYELNSHFNDFVKISHRLYNLLFNNARTTGASIIISPDGTNYPFEALIVNENIKQPDYFLNHYATSYTYSVKYLTNQFAVNKNSSNSILGIAPVHYSKPQNLAELSGSNESLQTINSYFKNTTSYVLEKATKNNFLRNFPDYSIIQLYTHASGTSVNEDPVIYFSDSALYLSELIPDRKPVTQLVVLSACETAKGKLYQGEGIFSFNRGFAALGIPASISNLWSADNESTYTITELFYKYLSYGLPTDIALQKAKLEFINNDSSSRKALPYFWASSILIGKVEVFKSNSGLSWTKLVAITFLVLAFIFIISKALRL